MDCSKNGRLQPVDAKLFEDLIIKELHIYGFNGDSPGRQKAKSRLLFWRPRIVLNHRTMVIRTMVTT